MEALDYVIRRAIEERSNSIACIVIGGTLSTC
jgi:hypothetical protein